VAGLHTARGWGLRACAVLAALVAAAAGGGGRQAVADRADASQACAGVVAGSPQTAPSAGRPCWVAVDPYPFGASGSAVPGGCGTSFSTCLQVTSLAFRAWNRGLAATNVNVGTTPFRLWLYNGTRWYPDPTYPGPGTCPGGVVLWAGKLDYWLIGQGSSSSPWAGLCRFDGADFVWEPLKLPAATLARVPTQPNGQLRAGGITSGTCFSWDNCWFFGSFGTIVHWDGTSLTDESPSLTKSPGLGVEYQAADSQGSSGVAVASSSDRGGNEMPGLTPGGPPAQLFSSPDGTSWSSSGYAPPTLPEPANSSPYNTDLVAVSLAANGVAWVAGDPAGWEPGLDAKPPSSSSAGARGLLDTPEPAPLEPVALAGASPCATPPAGRFSFVEYHTQTPPAGAYGPSYLWTSISAVPGTTTAIAGGLFRPGAGDPLEPPAAAAFDDYEPVVVRVSCTDPGAATVTRFAVPATGAKLWTPAESNRGVIAVAANADNDAWAATALHLYRLGDGQPPDAPAGNDDETRPLQLKEDPPIVVFAPVPPPPPPPAPIVSATTQTLPPAVYAITAKLHRRGKSHTTFDLYVSFKVRRKVTLGLEAVRGKAVVAKAKLQTFDPPQGRIVLTLSRRHWPKRIAFLTDTPKVSLQLPAGTLQGTVTVGAAASAIAGRTMATVRFDYSPAGANTWTSIGTAKSAPFSVQLDTSTLKSGGYDFRAVATDSAGVAAISNVISNRTVAGGGAS
jgi:hypothetical protein